MSLLSYDFAYVLAERIGADGLTPAELVEARELARSAHGAFAARKAAGGSYSCGFVDLPGTSEHAAASCRLAEQLRPACDRLVLLGIGGSALSAATIRDALAPAAAAGTAPVALDLVDNSDPELLMSVLDRARPDRTAFNVVSKSGTTVETIAAFLIAWDWMVRQLGEAAARRRFVVTTDARPEESPLRRLAEELQLPALAIPPDVGGRFNALTPVGLFPAAMLGIDPWRLLCGAAQVAAACASDDLAANPALAGAVVHYLLDQRHGKRIQVMMPYANRLRTLADWWAQIWAESLGKALHLDGTPAGVGQTPVRALGATDQHSQLQLYMEGPRDKVLTFLRLDRFGATAPIPPAWPDFAPYSYLAGRTVEELIQAEQKATARALADAGRPSLTLTLPRLDAEVLGALFQLLAMQTAYAGELYQVDAFDQPGVEAAKTWTAALMGRPGTEQQAQEMRRPEPVAWRVELAEPAAAPWFGPHEAAELERGLRETGALLEGHFLLRSGLHSPFYYQMARLLQHPAWAARVGQWLARPWLDAAVECVVGPALGGVIVAHEVARQLGCRCLFAEKDASGRLELRRSFEIPAGAPVLVVEDVLTRGTAVGETLAAVRAAGGAPLGIAVILDRSGGERPEFGIALRALLERAVEAHPPAACPLCRAGSPVVKPGSGPARGAQGN